MNTVKNIGLIECGSLQKPLFLSPVNMEEGYSITKVLSTTNANEINIKSRYPQAEIVDNTRAILDDHSIELVIVSGNNNDAMGFVGEAIQAGKQIRVI